MLNHLSGQHQVYKHNNVENEETRYKLCIDETSSEYSDNENVAEESKITKMSNKRIKKINNVRYN